MKGRMSVLALVAIFGCAVARLGFAGEKAAGEPLDAKAGFELLKKLAGDWTGTAGADGAKHTPGALEDKSLEVNYRVAAMGSTVIETYYAGDPKEMISVFTMDGPERLVMTHYCALRNAPRMKFEKGDKPGELKFVFDGGANFDPQKDLHVHEGTIRFLSDDKIESAFAAFKDGKKLTTNTLILTRKK